MSFGVSPISSAAISDAGPDLSDVSAIGDLEFTILAIQTSYIQQILNDQRSRRFVIAIELPVQAT